MSSEDRAAPDLSTFSPRSAPTTNVAMPSARSDRRPFGTSQTRKNFSPSATNRKTSARRAATSSAAAPCHSFSSAANAAHAASSQRTSPVRLLSAISHASCNVSWRWSSASSLSRVTLAARTYSSTHASSAPSRAPPASTTGNQRACQPSSSRTKSGKNFPSATRRAASRCFGLSVFIGERQTGARPTGATRRGRRQKSPEGQGSPARRRS